MFGFELDPQIKGVDLELGAHIAAIFDAPALTFNLSREEGSDLPCVVDKHNKMGIVSSEVSFGMGFEASLYASSPDMPIPRTNGTFDAGLFQIQLPALTIPIISKVVSAASTCIGEVKGTETEGLVVVTSVTPSPTSSAALGKPTAPGGAKIAAGDASIFVADMCIVLLTMVAMLFMSL
jgi:hypothetical protein